MKIIRKIAAILVALSLSLMLFAGCQQQSAEKIDIGIIQLIENGAFNDMREGFIQQMKEKGYDDSTANFHYKNAQGDSTNLNTICQEMVDNGMDLVVTIATPASQAMVNLESDIPVFFISVSNPVEARIISDMEKPDKNATGTSNAIPVNEIFDLADQLTPGCQTYGFLYNTGEINAVTTVESCKEYLDSIGLSYEEAVVTNSSEVQQAAQSLVGKVDAFFIPNDPKRDEPGVGSGARGWNSRLLQFQYHCGIGRICHRRHQRYPDWRHHCGYGDGIPRRQGDRRYPIGCRPGYRRSDQQDHCRNHWRRDPGGYRRLRHFSGRCPIAVFPE